MSEFEQIYGPIYGGRGTAASASWDHGVVTCRVALLAREIGVRLISVNPSTLKRWTCGKGNAAQSEMALEVLERWGVRFPDDKGADKAHAFALHKYGLALLDGSLEHVESQKRGHKRKLPPLRFQDVPESMYAMLLESPTGEIKVAGRRPLPSVEIPKAWRARAARVLKAGGAA